MTDLRVSCAAVSDPGREPDKQVNEDAYGMAAIGGSLFAVVCDGMGGHTGGRVASHTAVETIQRTLLNADPTQPTRIRLNQAILAASAAVYRVGGDAALTERPGATCVAVWLHQSTLDVAHVGDSRAYRWRAGKLEALTRDHSVIEAWIEAGQVTREQAHQHPEAHRITRALGMSPHVEVELRKSDQLLAGDTFLLCSDGLTDLVTEADLASLLSRSCTLEQKATEAVALANARGGHDNITVVLLEATDAAQPGVAVGGAPMNVLLTTPAVSATATEQLGARPEPLDKTQALDRVDQTVLMDGPQLPSAEANRTLPFAQVGTLGPATAPSPYATRPSSPPRVGPSPRQLLLLVGITLLLIGFAILFGLFRR